MILQQPGQRIFTIPGPEFGIELRQQVSGIDWWKAGGATGCVAAYQPKGAASLAASYTNLANPGTYDCTLGVAPTWGALTGWTFNGSTQFLKTGVIPATGWSALIQFSGVGTGLYMFGEYDAVATKGMMIMPNYTSKVLYYNGGGLFGAPQLLAGNLGVAGQTAYRNGVAEAGTIAAWGGTPVQIFIGGYNSGGSLTSPLAYNCQALAVYNTILSAPQMLAVATAMAAL